MVLCISLYCIRIKVTAVNKVSCVGREGEEKEGEGEQAREGSGSVEWSAVGQG